MFVLTKKKKYVSMLTFPIPQIAHTGLPIHSFVYLNQG